MLLFELSFPILTNEDELYFRGNGTSFSDGILKINGGTICSFFTYFNSFSAGKYKKYTNANNIILFLKIKGSAELFIKRKNGDIISSKKFNNITDDKCSIPFCIDNADSGEIYYAELHAKSDCSLFSGYYEATCNPNREVKLGVSVCTYKREKYVISNIERLKRFSNKYSLPIKVFVIDNASTLPYTLSDERISIYSNPNCGGSGGFARGLLEATEANCTHIIFLDDDITLDTNVILKTYTLLTILREEYFESFIGGAMLLSEKAYEQHECGALWDGFLLTPLGHEMDMRKKSNIIFNEKLPMPDYQAWWYCCFPTAFGEKFGYPMPYFIKTDDVEYGVRCKKPIINMNGISVWHDGFQNKYVGYFEYYIKRNELITTALHCNRLGIVINIKKLFYAICKLTLLQCDFLAKLTVKAYDDFLDGPERLIATNPETFNIQLANSSKQSADQNIIGNATTINNPKHINNLLYFLTFGGYILPSKNICINLDLTDTDINKTYRARYIYHIDTDKNIQFVSRRKKRKLFWVIYQTIRMFLKFVFKYKNVRKEYIEKQDKFMSKQFWENYFSQYRKN